LAAAMTVLVRCDSFQELDGDRERTNVVWPQVAR
jgi:hypothetical protein